MPPRQNNLKIASHRIKYCLFSLDGGIGLRFFFVAVHNMFLSQIRCYQFIYTYIRNKTYVYNVGVQPSCNSIALELRSDGAGVFMTGCFDGNTVDCVATVYEA